MNPMEMRQAKRMLRNAKEAERFLFRLIELVGDWNSETAIDWQAVRHNLEVSFEYLHVVDSLLDATDQALHGGGENYVAEPGTGIE